MPIQDVIAIWGQPTEVHEPWKIMQQQELSDSGSGEYLKGTPYDATRWVGRPSHPNYIGRLTVYLFRHPIIDGKKLACNIELMADEEGKLTAGIGVSNCPRACPMNRAQFSHWLQGIVDNAACEEAF